MPNIAFQKRYLLSIVISLLLITMLFSCINDKKEAGKYKDREILPMQSVRDVELLYSEKGTIKARLLSPEMNNYITDKKYTEMPKGIEVYFYDIHKKETSRLIAKYAIRYDDTHIMEAKHNVEVKNIKGEVLNTEHLIWDEQKEIIYTEAFVKITTANEVLLGEGLISDQYFSHYEIKKPTGTFSLKQE